MHSPFFKSNTLLLILALCLSACGGGGGSPGPAPRPVDDTTPDQFSFTAITDVDAAVLISSTPVSVAGINAPTALSITGGEYSINNATFTAADGTVTNGQAVTVRVTSSANSQGVVSAELSIGGVKATNNRLLVTRSDGGITAVDLASGARVIISR